jgi:HlyD family secretion protein
LPAGISLGELAEVTLKLPTTQARFLVPNASLKRLNDQLGVWLYQEGKASSSPSKLARAASMAKSKSSTA